ncbi:hypothetical protein BDN72DRAFT_897359 [Pluteus cervinus]|uniref:Uncharacterized protein n=1 Tax=Pluteus cervinus TaxID=181527 RepID=A0ACD3AUI7_9AGAR|nr:hypothetical protein BDN72DRAFT_897359 [Pluteus cervinus]
MASSYEIPFKSIITDKVVEWPNELSLFTSHLARSSDPNIEHPVPTRILHDIAFFQALISKISQSTSNQQKSCLQEVALGFLGNVIQLAHSDGVLLYNVDVAHSSTVLQDRMDISNPKVPCIKAPLLLGCPCNLKPKSLSEALPQVTWNANLSDADTWGLLFENTGEDLTYQDNWKDLVQVPALGSTFLSLVIVAAPDDLIPLLSSAIFQNKVWNRDDPVMGIAIIPETTLVHLMFGHVRNFEEIHIVQPQDTNTPSPKMGVFDLANQDSIHNLLQFILELKPHFTMLAKNIKSCEPQRVERSPDSSEESSEELENSQTDRNPLLNTLDNSPSSNLKSIEKWLFWRRALPCVCMEVTYQSKHQEVLKMIEIYKKTCQPIWSRNLATESLPDHLTQRLNEHSPSFELVEGTLGETSEVALDLAIVISNMASMQKEIAGNCALYSFQEHEQNLQNLWVPWNILLSMLMDSSIFVEKSRGQIVKWVDCDVKLSQNELMSLHIDSRFYKEHSTGLADYYSTLKYAPHVGEDGQFSRFGFEFGQELCTFLLQSEEIKNSTIDIIQNLQNSYKQERGTLGCKTVIGVLASKWAPSNLALDKDALNSVLFVQTPVPPTGIESSYSQDSILLPMLIITHTNNPHSQGTEHTKMASVSAVKFLAALGITDQPVFHLTINEIKAGQREVPHITVRTAFQQYSLSKQVAFFTSHNVAAYNIAEPLGAYSIITTIMKIMEGGLKLQQTFERGQHGLHSQIAKGPPYATSSWTHIAQLKVVAKSQEGQELGSQESGSDEQNDHEKAETSDDGDKDDDGGEDDEH